MDLVRAFEEIDIDFSGKISKDELRRYMVKKNYDMSFVNKWLAIFDPDQTGRVTLDEFCDALGLQPSEEYLQRVHSKQLGQTKPVFPFRAPQSDYDYENLTCHTVAAEKEDETQETEEEIVDVEILRQDPDTTEELRQFAIDICHQSAKDNRLEKDAARNIKRRLDAEHGRSWQVVVARSTFGSFFSHLAGRFMHFKIDDHCFLIWQTPIQDD